MLETIAVILLVLWLLGFVSGYTMGNFIYVLLVVAIVLFLARLASGRRVVCCCSRSRGMRRRIDERAAQAVRGREVPVAACATASATGGFDVVRASTVS